MQWLWLSSVFSIGPKDSDLIVAGSTFILHLELVNICMLCNSQLDWREPIGLQERLEGRSSHNGEFLHDLHESSRGNRQYGV